MGPGAVQGGGAADSGEAGGSPREEGRVPWNGFTWRERGPHFGQCHSPGGVWQALAGPCSRTFVGLSEEKNSLQGYGDIPEDCPLPLACLGMCT